MWKSYFPLYAPQWRPDNYPILVGCKKTWNEHALRGRMFIACLCVAQGLTTLWTSYVKDHEEIRLSHEHLNHITPKHTPGMHRRQSGFPRRCRASPSPWRRPWRELYARGRTPMPSPHRAARDSPSWTRWVVRCAQVQQDALSKIYWGLFWSHDWGVKRTEKFSDVMCTCPLTLIIPCFQWREVDAASSTISRLPPPMPPVAPAPRLRRANSSTMTIGGRGNRTKMMLTVSSTQ